MLLNLTHPFRIRNEVFSLTSSIFSWTSDPSEPPTALNRMTLTHKSMRIQISSLSLRSRVMQHSHRGCVMCRRCSCPGVASDCHTHFAHTLRSPYFCHLHSFNWNGTKCPTTTANHSTFTWRGALWVAPRPTPTCPPLHWPLSTCVNFCVFHKKPKQ